jgi:hypothetical protein
MSVNIDTEKRLIRGVWDQAVEALATKNWDAYSQFWAHDVYIQVIHPPRVIGPVAGTKSR